jgi:hypothetical protein
VRFDAKVRSGMVVTPDGVIVLAGYLRVSRGGSATRMLLFNRYDPLVPLDCGIDTAESVQGSKLVVIRGMGHALPISMWQQIIDAIAAHAAYPQLPCVAIRRGPLTALLGRSQLSKCSICRKITSLFQF